MPPTDREKKLKKIANITDIVKSASKYKKNVDLEESEYQKNLAKYTKTKGKVKINRKKEYAALDRREEAFADIKKKKREILK